MRFFALQLAIETFFGFFTSGDVTRTCGLFFSAIGFPLLTIFEYKGLTNFFKDYLWHENPHAHGSHPWFRTSEKAFAGLQGLIFTMPLLVLSLQACDKWFIGQLWMKLLTIPYLFAEFTTQTIGFHDTYNRKVGTGMVGIYNKYFRKKVLGEGPRNDYKKDQILEVIGNMKKRVGNLPPTVLQQLDQSLNTASEELDEI